MNRLKQFAFLLLLTMYSCGGGGESTQNQTQEETSKTEEPKEEEKTEEKVEEGPKLSEAAIKGQEIFKTNCTTCHQLAEAEKVTVGPGLKGVTERRTKEWIKSFVKNSQEFIKSGDKDAVAVFEKFNKIPMTSFDLKDDEFEALFAYLQEGSKVE